MLMSLKKKGHYSMQYCKGTTACNTVKVYYEDEEIRPGG